MQEVRVPWGQWYEQSYRSLFFPDDWKVRICCDAQAPALSGEKIEEQIDQPIGTVTLSEMAAGKESACIIMDDISRPTPGAVLLPILIEKLHNAGMPYDKIRVLIALGGHRPMTRKEMEIKVGSWVLDHVQVLNHSPFASDLVTISDEQQVIKINKVFMDAQLHIAVGCIEPHILAGYSGGAKAVIPGIGGVETLIENHTLVFADKEKNRSFAVNTCNPDNPMRKNMEAIVGKVGLDFIVNVVLNDRMEIAACFAGHYIRAHREACRVAGEMLRTPLVRDADIVITGSYPKDTEYQQIGTCFAVFGQHKKECIRQDGTVIVMSAASEGVGWHYLFGPGMPLFSPHEDNVPPADIADRDLMIYSDGVTRQDISQFYRGDAPPVYKSWEDILEKLQEKYAGRTPLVAVYPEGSIQIGVLEAGE